MGQGDRYSQTTNLETRLNLQNTSKNCRDFTEFDKHPFLLGKVVRPEGLELSTFWFVARRSIQLSYGRTEAFNLL